MACRLIIFYTIVAVIIQIVPTRSSDDENINSLSELIGKLESLANTLETPGEPVPNTHKHHNHGKKSHSHHARDNNRNNLMNVQNLNLYVKDRHHDRHGKSTHNHKNVGKKLRYVKVNNLNDAEDQLRCVGKRCGNNEDSNLDIKELRCSGTRCSLVDGNDGQINIEVIDNKKTKSERCQGTRCGRTNSDTNISDKLANIGRKYKINNNLDVLVVGTSDLENLLDPTTKTRQNIKKLPKDKNTKLSADELVRFYTKVKNDIIDTAANYVKDDVDVSVVDFLPKPKLDRLKKLRKVALEKKDNIDNDKLNNVINNELFEEQNSFEVLPHKEKRNTILIPQWLYSAATATKKLSSKYGIDLPASKDNLKTRRNLHAKRTAEQGFPFELEVHGIGQINPNQ